MVLRILRSFALVLCLMATPALSASAAESGQRSIPGTISPQAQAVLEMLYASRQTEMKVPQPQDVAAWKALHAVVEEQRSAPTSRFLATAPVTITETKAGGIPVLDIRPHGWTETPDLLVYIHGGAFTLLSARSTADNAALMSLATGLRVISIDYTNPPAARWNDIQGQIMAVFDALLQRGHRMDRMAVYGDSAGGNLVVRSVLNLRDAGKGSPTAVVLFSPWADLTDSGDTAITLKEADPTLTYANLLANSAQAYAGGLDLRDPRVSPLFADFTKGFPPTLIQEGTRTIFLSTSVRLYQALKAAKAEAVIDMHEGMWHVFQVAPIPEAELAVAEAGRFIRSRLQ